MSLDGAFEVCLFLNHRPHVLIGSANFLKQFDHNVSPVHRVLQNSAGLGELAQTEIDAALCRYFPFETALRPVSGNEPLSIWPDKPLLHAFGNVLDYITRRIIHVGSLVPAGRAAFGLFSAVSVGNA